MKKITMMASSMMILGAMAFASINAFAAPISANTSVNSQRGGFSWNQDATQTMRPHFGARPELTEEQKAEMLERCKERLAEQLADEKITQEQYDQAIADIKNGEMPTGLGGRGNRAFVELTEEQKAEMLERCKERLAEQLADGKITQEQYDQAVLDVENGERPAFFGKGRGDKFKTSATDVQSGETV